MSNNNMHPEILDGLDYEQKFIQQTSGAQRRTVKLNRGDSWLLRFLPVKFATNGKWYARVAKHWVNQRAVVCPRQTEEAYGGHPEAYCPVCELSEVLNNERSEDVSKFGFKLRANANWITWCAVFAKAANGGAEQAMPLPEVLQPYEFPHYRTSWEELTGFVRQGVRRTPQSVLDLEKGNDFYASKTNKGLRLDKQDAAPIFDLNDPKFDENCQKLIAACKEPNVKIPDEKTLDSFADKAQEEADNLARGGGGKGRGSARGPRNQDEDDLPPDDAPARGRHAEQEDQGGHEAPPARGRTAAAPAAAPTRRAAPAPAAAPVRTAAPPARRAAPAPAPEPEQPAEDQGDPGADPGDPGDQGDQPTVDEGGDLPPEEQAPEPPPAAPARRAAPAPATAPARPSATRPSATRTPPPAPARAAAPTAPARTAPRGGPVAQESIDEHEHIPEENSDQAPPAPLVDPADDPGSEGGDAPPPVENTRRGQFSSSIKNKIAAVNTSTKK